MVRNAALFFFAASLITMLAVPHQASADPQVEIEWATDGAGPVNNPDLTARVGDTITATVYLENTTGTIAGYGIGLTHDASELSLQSSTEHLPTGFGLNFDAGTGDFGFGCGTLFEAAIAIGSPGVGDRFAIGQAEFLVVDVISDAQPDVSTAPCIAESVYDGSLADVTGGTTSQSGQVHVTAIPTLGRSGIVVLASLMLAAMIWAVARRRAATG